MPRLLLLRAEPAAGRTRRAAERLGHEELAAPIFEIVPLRGRLPRPAGSYALVIAASESALAMLDPADRAALAGLAARVVGSRSGELAQGLGLRPAAPLHRTARDLAAAIPPGLSGPVLYLAGEHRQPEIEAALRASSVEFDLVEVYAARAAARLPEEACAALRGGTIAAVLHYSPRSAETYRLLAEAAGLLDAALAPVQLCLSAAVAEPLEKAGAKRLRIASAPEEERLLELIPGVDGE